MDLRQLHSELAAIPKDKSGGSQFGEAAIIDAIFSKMKGSIKRV